MDVNRYERLWISITMVAVVAMLIATVIAGFGLGVQLPGVAGVVDPRTLAQSPPFDKPGVYPLDGNRYQVIMIAQVWAFNPNEIRVPVGAQLNFKVTSRDVTHGILVEGTTANVMILPGQISTFDLTLDTAGTYQFICHEYCGSGHQAMAGKIIVEP
jgi:cytochrome c oxidase subunit 2